MKLALNGINLGAFAAAQGDLSESQRDIGGEVLAVDGSTITTRSARKIDVELKSIPLLIAAALVWRDFIAGEGETWSFDLSLYGSKGTAPIAMVGATFSAGAAKFGAAKLSVGATTGTITFPAAANEYGSTKNGWTVGVWRFEGGVWNHYVVRSGGAKWVNGVRNDAASTTWLTVVAPNVTIANNTGAAVFYDDLVILPFQVLLDWPPQWFAAAAPFGLLPFHAATGDFVEEQATRVVLGRVPKRLRTRAHDIITSIEAGLVAK